MKSVAGTGFEPVHSGPWNPSEVPFPLSCVISVSRSRTDISLIYSIRRTFLLYDYAAFRSLNVMFNGHDRSEYLTGLCAMGCYMLFTVHRGYWFQLCACLFSVGYMSK